MCSFPDVPWSTPNGLEGPKPKVHLKFAYTIHRLAHQIRRVARSDHEHNSSFHRNGAAGFAHRRSNRTARPVRVKKNRPEGRHGSFRRGCLKGRILVRRNRDFSNCEMSMTNCDFCNRSGDATECLPLSWRYRRRIFSVPPVVRAASPKARVDGRFAPGAGQVPPHPSPRRARPGHPAYWMRATATSRRPY